MLFHPIPFLCIIHPIPSPPLPLFLRKLKILAPVYMCIVEWRSGHFTEALSYGLVVYRGITRLEGKDICLYTGYVILAFPFLSLFFLFFARRALLRTHLPTLFASAFHLHLFRFYLAFLLFYGFRGLVDFPHLVMLGGVCQMFFDQGHYGVAALLCDKIKIICKLMEPEYDFVSLSLSPPPSVPLSPFTPPPPFFFES